MCCFFMKRQLQALHRLQTRVTVASLVTLILLVATTLAACSALQGASGLLPLDTHGAVAGSTWALVAFLTLGGMAVAMGREKPRQRQEVSSTAVALHRHFIVFTTDEQGRLLSVNELLCKLSGYAREELLGQCISTVNPCTRAPDLLQELLDTLSIGSGWQGDVCCRAKDGHLYWMHISATHFAPVRNQPGHWAVIGSDISTRKSLEAERQRGQTLSEQASQAKSAFVAHMGHEIRTPMNCILGMANLALDSHNPQDHMEYMAIVKSSAESLQVTLNEFLDFSKLEANQLSMERVAFDLRQTVAEAIQPLRTVARSKGLSLHCSVAPDVPFQVCGDPPRLRQVLANLLGNAVKFTTTGQVSCEVCVDARNDSSVALCFMVQDTGIGIAPEQLRRVFEAFSQADASTARSFGGTGLGLSIASRLVDLMGGYLDVQSTVGKGSTFSFTVVLDVVASDLPTQFDTHAISAIHTTPPPAPNRLQVLLVEDHPINQKLALRLLEKGGHCATLAENGQLALDLIASGQVFDLVLMDVQMPVMDGLEACQKLRQLETQRGWRPLPVIAMTASALTRDRKACRDAGMNDYLAKPMNPHALTTVINHYAGR